MQFVVLDQQHFELYGPFDSKANAQKWRDAADDTVCEEDEWVVLEIKPPFLTEIVGVCKFCGQKVGPEYHLHQDGLVGDCCWDDRLKTTE